MPNLETQEEAVVTRVADQKRPRYRIAIVTSIHPDFDARIWKHANTVRDLGHEVHLVCPWDVPDGTIHEGVHFHTFPRVRTRLRRLWQIPARVLGKVLPLLRHVDLVHFHDIDILPLIAPLRVMRPIVYDVHENYPEEMLVRDWIPRPLRWPLYIGVFVVQFVLAQLAHNIVLVSHHQEDRDFKSDWFNKIVVHNYASTALLDGVAYDYRSRPDAVVFVGSQNIENGSLLLLEIAAGVRARAPHVVFYAPDRFMNPAFRERFLAERERQGLEQGLVLLPNVKPHLLVKETLNRATVAISPNLRVKQQIKGAHNKIYEFMAAALPIVCSDLPDQVEAVAGNEAGLVARPEDPASFVDAVLRLVNDRAYAESLGKNGQRAFRSKYNWQSQALLYEAFYEGILGSKRAQRMTEGPATR